ncbi:MAG: hypothetical protein PVJ57_17595 [Phycisphaerae bacterium]
MSTVDLITAELVLSWRPCSQFPRERVRELFGDGLTPLEVCGLEVPSRDRLWVLLRDEIVPIRTMLLLACRWAYGVQPIYDRWHPDDRRVRDGIRVARRYVLGQTEATALSAVEKRLIAAAAAAARDSYNGTSVAAETAFAAVRATKCFARSARDHYRASLWTELAVGHVEFASWMAAHINKRSPDAIWAAQLADVRAVLTGELDLATEAHAALETEGVA